jgi:hypothetical protein
MTPVPEIDDVVAHGSPSRPTDEQRTVVYACIAMALSRMFFYLVDAGGRCERPIGCLVSGDRGLYSGLLLLAEKSRYCAELLRHGLHGAIQPQHRGGERTHFVPLAANFGQQALHLASRSTAVIG